MKWFLYMALCLSTIGCSSLAQFMQGEAKDQLDIAWAQGITNHEPGSLQIYDAKLYTLHLEVDETDLQMEGPEHLNGDGGASLNAYAACLTLKVIF